MKLWSDRAMTPGLTLGFSPSINLAPKCYFKSYDLLWLEGDLSLILIVGFKCVGSGRRYLIVGLIIGLLAL